MSIQNTNEHRTEVGMAQESTAVVPNKTDQTDTILVHNTIMDIL